MEIILKLLVIFHIMPFSDKDFMYIDNLSIF
jgi:hypothetical protein